MDVSQISSRTEAKQNKRSTEEVQSQVIIPCVGFSGNESKFRNVVWAIHLMFFILMIEMTIYKWRRLWPLQLPLSLQFYKIQDTL